MMVQSPRRSLVCYETLIRDQWTARYEYHLVRSSDSELIRDFLIFVLVQSKLTFSNFFVLVQPITVLESVTQTDFQVFSIASMATMALAKPKEDVFAMPDDYFQGPNTERRYNDLHAITLHYNPDFDHRKFWYYG